MMLSRASSLYTERESGARARIPEQKLWAAPADYSRGDHERRRRAPQEEAKGSGPPVTAAVIRLQFKQLRLRTLGLMAMKTWLLLLLAVVLEKAPEMGIAQNYACGGDGSRRADDAVVGFCDREKGVDERVADIVRRMTLAEKAAQLVNAAEGVARIGIPPYEWWSEALHGVSDVGPGTSFHLRRAAATLSNNISNSNNLNYIASATSFPQVILSAASFNASLWTSIGQAVSTEARAMYNYGQAGLTFWSPNVNIYRDPRWGRGQETAGEDPLLASSYAAAYVRGLQDVGDGGVDRLKVAACCKHFTAYDLDNWNGIDRFHFDAKVSQQDLDDTYNPPFKSCVQDGGAACVMCSYNRVNGVPTCVDGGLLQETLRQQWGLKGYIASDCDSVDVLYRDIHYTASPEDAAAAAINAGLNMNCGNFLAKHTEKAVELGKLSEQKVDEALSELYRVLMRLGFFDGDPVTEGGPFSSLGPPDTCSSSHVELALEAARQGIVLLKNDAGALPLSAAGTQNLAVIGPLSNATIAMIGNYAGVPCEYITPLQGLARYARSVTHVAGCGDVACSSVADSTLADAVAAAEVADAVVLVMGLDQSEEREGKDRISLGLPGQQEMLTSRVASAAKGPVVLVLMTGGPVDVEFAKKDERIRGMVWVGYPGQAGGQAIAETIFGDHNPAGKLPVSWYPESYTQMSMADMRMRADGGAGYPGRTYRFHTGPLVFPFGHGLSYTRFSHTLLFRSRSHRHLTLPRGVGRPFSPAYAPVAGLTCGDLHVDLRLDVTNVGSWAGSHVALVFWHPPVSWREGRGAPVRQLVAFRRLHGMAPGEVRRVHVELNVCEHMSVVEEESGERVVPTGTHTLVMGESLQQHNITFSLRGL